MRYKKLGNSDIDVSVVSLGAWAIGGDSNWGASDDDMSIRTIHEAHNLGITLLDTAPAYGLGHSEEVVGKALKGRRSDFVLSTKCGLVWDGGEGSVLMSRDGVTLLRNLSAKSVRKQLEESLKRLQTDYIDIFITHWQATEPFLVPIEETMGALNEFVREGKIRAIGISNVTADQIDELKIGPKANLDKTTLRDVIRLFRRYNLIAPLDRDVTQSDARIKIYPSILFAVPNDNLNSMYDTVNEKLNQYATGGESSDDEDAYQD